MNGFFIFFASLIIIGTLIFMLIYTGSEFECRLLKGGYFKVRWNEKKRKIETLYWQPKKNPAAPANKMIYIEGKSEK